MARPRLLDICCCQGGAARGYHDAGFDITGIDTEPQPNYPYTFIRGDGLKLLADPGFIRQFDAIHTSWPCQGYTNCQKIRGNDHPKLIEPGRELLRATGLPYVQENVPGAPLIDPVELCGAMFGLHTYRHRLFETNWPLTAPAHPEHVHPTVKMGRPLREGDWYHAVGNFSNVPYVRADLGVPWMTRDGIRECIPPAYTRFVGEQLMAVVEGRRRPAQLDLLDLAVA